MKCRQKKSFMLFAFNGIFFKGKYYVNNYCIKSASCIVGLAMLFFDMMLAITKGALGSTVAGFWSTVSL